MVGSWFSQAVEYLYRLESRWGLEILALYGAGIITMLVLFRSLLESRRLGFSWPWSFVRSFFLSAWVFALVYCLILKAPLWMTFLFSMGFWLGGKLLIAFLLSGQTIRTRREKPAAHS